MLPYSSGRLAQTQAAAAGAAAGALVGLQMAAEDPKKKPWTVYMKNQHRTKVAGSLRKVGFGHRCWVLLLLLLLWVATGGLDSLLQQPDSRTCSFSRSAAEYDMEATAA
jgi:hypothetical protein